MDVRVKECVAEGTDTREKERPPVDESLRSVEESIN